jgi:hypothetical protein
LAVLGPEPAQHCEDAFDLGHSNQRANLAARLDLLISTCKFPKFEDKIRQLGSYGGGNLSDREFRDHSRGALADFCASPGVRSAGSRSLTQ